MDVSRFTLFGGEYEEPKGSLIKCLVQSVGRSEANQTEAKLLFKPIVNSFKRNILFVMSRTESD